MGYRDEKGHAVGRGLVDWMGWISVSKDQVAVAEFVPEVAFADGLGVGVADEVLTGDGIQHGEVAGDRVMEAGDQTVDGVHAAPGMDVQPREAGGSAHVVDIP